MKTFVLFFLLIGSVIQTRASKELISLHEVKSDTTILPQILSIPLSSYIGKPVDSLFLALPSNYSFRGFIPVGIGYCKGVFQSYGNTGSNHVTVDVFIDTFRYLPIPNRTKSSTWNMILAKKETVAYIRVVKNNTICVFGCSNPNYDY